MKTTGKAISVKLAILFASSMLALSTFGPASAAGQADYGVWSEPTTNAETGAFEGTVSFAGTTIPGASYSTVFSAAAEGNEVTLKDTTEEWVSEETPFGKDFGANGKSETNNFLRSGVASSDEPYIFSTTTITFDEAVPADSLGILIGDVDIDQVSISAKNPAGDDLSGDEISGSSTSNAFNLCDVTKNVPLICADVENKKDVPVFTKGATSVTFKNSEVGEDIGVNGWVKPSVEIASLVIVHTGQGADSTIRIGLAGPVIPTLAETGLGKRDLFGYALTMILLGSAVLVSARRRLI